MRNPWLKKNPFMSLWLSGANRMMGTARGQLSAGVKREVIEAGAGVTATAAQQVTEFWTNTTTKSPVAVKSRLFVHPLDEQFRLLAAPLLQRLNGRLMLQSSLRDEVVVG